MEWSNILAGIITFLVLTIGLPLALRKRKKSGFQKVEQLLHHLQEIGVKASLAEKGVEEGKVGVSRSFMRRSEGVIKIRGRYIDYLSG